MANTPVDQLDFDSIKQSLKDYLRGQETFQDYDFEGSTMNILLDLLAYNTHYQAFYANMIAGEAFLDSARKRNSVVSLAKHLNYTPRSKKASRINVNVQYVSDNFVTDYNRARAGVLTLPRGTQFSARGSNGQTYIFNTMQDYKFQVLGTAFYALNVVLFEGILKSESYVINTKDTTQKLIISDKNIDTDSILVRVQRSVSDTTGIGDTWIQSTDMTKLNGDSTAFFLQEAENGYWQIYFGDGLLGRAVEHGNVVRIFYLSTNGKDANGIGSDDSASSPTFSSGESYLAEVAFDSNGVLQPSYGGDDPESTESIRTYAPRVYQAQERAVTANDYLAILAKDFSLRSESFLVWGGEENDPPQYGKVFISIKPKNSSKLSALEKQAISTNILREKNVLTITPEVVDADLTYIIPTINVYYDPNKTVATSSELSTALFARTVEYSNNNLNKFGSNFRASKFSAFIDNQDPAIRSSSLNLVLEKRIEMQFNKTLAYTIKFDNVLDHPMDGYPPIVESSGFYYADLSSDATVKPTVVCYLDDDGYGNIRLYKYVNNITKVYILNDLGTVDYTTGKIVLKNFNPIGTPTGELELKIRTIPERKDIFVRRNQVLEISSDDIEINMIQEKTVIDNNASDTGFPF